MKALLSRRRVAGGIAAMAGLPALAPALCLPALAQSAQPAAPGAGAWRDFAALVQEADRLGLSVPRLSAGVQGGTDFDQLMPALVDFMQDVEASAARSPAPAADVERLLEQTSELLRRLRQAERSPPTDRDQVTGAATQARPTFESLRDDYIRLFQTCTIREERSSEVSWYLAKLTDPASRKQYDAVKDKACVPWYFVGIIHAMEATFDFRSHLHNGDSLSRKTVQVPSGRPPVWNPPTDWVSSAVDAVTYDGFADEQDWSLPRMLYRFESYNGWRSRIEHKINTPYLWSFSNHYTKGKFVADNVWDPNAVSRQCGAAVMLKALVERGLVALPA
jgi:lysozyme family protein